MASHSATALIRRFATALAHHVQRHNLGGDEACQDDSRGDPRSDRAGDDPAALKQGLTVIPGTADAGPGDANGDPGGRVRDGSHRLISK
jgi:hypothetical protein